MADYNIYIRNMNTGGQNDPTRPWSNDNSSPESNPTAAWVEATQQGVSLGANPTQLASLGMGEVARMIPAIATAFVVKKLMDKVFNTAHTFHAETLQRQSGDFGASIRYNNLKQLYSNITNPFQTTLNIMVEEDSRRIENDRRNLQIALLGETMISRGV